MYNEGISRSGDLLDLAVELEMISKRGSYYSYGEMKLGQGRENAKSFLRENEDLHKEIEQTIRQEMIDVQASPPQISMPEEHPEEKIDAVEDVQVFAKKEEMALAQ
jgi:recombination protein RecA